MNTETLNKFMLSNGKQVTMNVLEDYSFVPSKSDILNYIKTKSDESTAILHIGFAGHKRSNADLIKKGMWFHREIEESFEKVFGVDIDEEAVNNCKDLKPDGKYYCIDALTHAEEIKAIMTSEGVDYKKLVILLPDVLEHIQDPIDFLSGIKEKYKGSSLLVSVPNAFSFTLLKRYFFRNYEWVNNDHKHLFDYSTLYKTATLAEIIPDDFLYIGCTDIPKLLKKYQLSGSIGFYVKEL